MWFGRARRERELQAADQLRVTRRLVDGDVTAFGEELAADHDEVLTGAFDERRREPTTSGRSTATTPPRSRSLPRPRPMRDRGRPGAQGRALLPGLRASRARRHGAAATAGPLLLRPPARALRPRTCRGWVERMVAACARDQQRLEQGEEPATRLVRVGDRWVPWHEVGSVAYVARQHSHVVRRGASTELTDGHLAEAHLRSATTGGMNAAPAEDGSAEPRKLAPARPETGARSAGTGACSTRSGGGGGRPRRSSRSGTGRP